MRSTRREVGDIGERLAAAFLERHGYAILQRNFRCREGEIDIVARQGESLVFVEVRAKRGSGFGTPEESITDLKKERLVSVADAYLQQCDDPPSTWRIDVVAIDLTRDNDIRRLEHIESAVP